MGNLHLFPYSAGDGQNEGNPDVMKDCQENKPDAETSKHGISYGSGLSSHRFCSVRGLRGNRRERSRRSADRTDGELGCIQRNWRWSYGNHQPGYAVGCHRHDSRSSHHNRAPDERVYGQALGLGHYWGESPTSFLFFNPLEEAGGVCG